VEMKAAPRVGLVGVGGYGQVHLQHLIDFHARNRLQLVAAVAFPPDLETEAQRQLQDIGAEVFSDLESLLQAKERLALDLAIVPTPIHLHARMTRALLAAGVNVLVEKPLAAVPADAEAIAVAARASGRFVAVGFQYLHAPEVQALKARLLAGAIGSVRRVVVHAAWPRSHAYYSRNNWAGRLRVGEDMVLDSPISNAMAHFLMLMLYLAGREHEAVAHPIRLTGELYRAQQIESFDTAAVRFETADGCRLEFYGTHSSRRIERPSLVIEGSSGTAEWEQDGYARIQTAAGGWEQLAGPESATREAMLQDILARVEGRPAFRCTPEMAAAHVRCVAQLHAHLPIRPVPAAELEHRTSGETVYTSIRGLDEVLAQAARDGSGLAAAGAAWAAAPVSAELA